MFKVYIGGSRNPPRYYRDVEVNKDGYLICFHQIGEDGDALIDLGPTIIRDWIMYQLVKE